MIIAACRYSMARSSRYKQNEQQSSEAYVYSHARLELLRKQLNKEVALFKRVRHANNRNDIGDEVSTMNSQLDSLNSQFDYLCSRMIAEGKLSHDKQMTRPTHDQLQVFMERAQRAQLQQNKQNTFLNQMKERARTQMLVEVEPLLRSQGEEQPARPATKNID